MNQWIAMIRYDEAKKMYFYTIQGSDGELLLESENYKSDSNCEQGVETLIQLIKSNESSCTNIEECGSWYFYEIVSKNHSVLGRGKPVNEKEACMQKLREFLQYIVSGEGSIINRSKDYERRLLPISSHVIDYMFSLDGIGFDAQQNPLEDNPTNIKQWENPNSIFWSNVKLRENFLKPILHMK